MSQIVESELFILLLTIGSYYVGVLINDRFRRPYTNPLMIALVVLIPLLLLLGIDFETYERGSHMVSYLLGPTVVALGYSLHCQIKYLKGNVVPILSTVVVGSVVGVVVVALICKLGDCPPEVIASMEPKSVTIPIALGIAERQDGIIALTAIVVFVTGILGSIIGPGVLDKVGVRKRVARGLAMGAAAHGIGTARAMQIGRLEGAIAGMTIGLMGVATAIVIPIVKHFWR